MNKPSARPSEDAPLLLGGALSCSGRRWAMRPADERLVQGMRQAHGLADALARLLVARGISIEEAARWLNPSLKALLPDPYVLVGMEAAAERLASAILAGERIAIFGDYDVDGATSSALMVRFLRALGCEPLIHIPDRLSEGYGPNIPAIDALHERGASLMVTVDCGTMSFAPLERAAEIGLDVIVLDHHKAEPALPQAVAIVNPNRLDQPAGMEYLAAVGVTFLTLVAVRRLLRERGLFGEGETLREPDLLQWLDLVALGTVCDMVPLVGVNRAFVMQGLKVMRRRENAGLRALADVARIDSPVDAYHLGFLLGPRINAGGRVGEADLGTRLLSGLEDEAEIMTIAARLDELNRERREIEDSVLAAGLADILRRQEAGEDRAVWVTAGEGWHVGVVGIVASRLVQRFGRPAVVLGIEQDERGVVIARGSARSIAGVDIGAAVLEAVETGLLMKGGGHPMAAGMSLVPEKIPEFQAFLDDLLGQATARAIDASRLMIDASTSVGGCDLDLVAELEAAAPFGIGNPAPRLMVPSARIVRADRVGERHVRLILAGGDGTRLKAIAFRVADEPFGETLLAGQGERFHFVGQLKKDDWGATPRPQLIVEDAAPGHLSIEPGK
ncbi:MAG: single-stranded-DNA-specific exonuclease RecJ [Alphaproteobacteria bacterium]|nr:MAG: single-stranded-DNA-specific exonuclease RecJ [Alphaproteobacteria bacterium]